MSAHDPANIHVMKRDRLRSNRSRRPRLIGGESACYSLTLRHRTPNRRFDNAGELRKVITAHFGAARRPLPASHVEGDVHVVARGM
jgi:hypothetical protein